MADGTYLLGLDIGGTKCAALLGDADGNVLARREWPSLVQRGAAAMLQDLLREARSLIADRRVRGVGVSIGGPMDAGRGIVLGPPNLPGWDHVPLKEILERELGVPARVEHDAAACALAEYRWGAGRGAKRLIYLTCGTGFGAGFVFDGRVYRGAGGLNVELGHMRIAPDGPEAFGKRGCAEALCSGQALGRIAAWQFAARWGTAAPASPEIAALAAQGDRDAQEVIRLNAASVGGVCAILGDMLRPDVIALGSLAQYLGEPWLEGVRAAFCAEALPASIEVCRIVPAGLGKRLQDLSALVVACAEEA